MSDIIKLLPDSIANQIAAGEVIQRPASVVKELVENSIDAGSTQIKLVIKEAGKVLIQVIDNGSGMSETDARMCFERHATSKIREANDLFSIKTMGFRGEAMASIAAVAQVELKTRLIKQTVGTRLVIEGSEVKAQEACQTPVGTSISVKNLFFNVPARRNFLKTNAVEMRHILDEFQRIALAHPNVFFSLHHNRVELFHLPVTNLRQRIVGIFGANYNQKLVPIKEETEILKLEGFVGKPEFGKKTRGEQLFFVNNRFIKSGYLHHAVMAAYEDLLPKETYPFYVIFIDIAPSFIDINVHPTKQEIKFEDERLVYNYLKVAVRHGLGQHNVMPSIDFSQEVNFSNFLKRIDPLTETTSDFVKSKLSPKEKEALQPTPLFPEEAERRANNQANWQKLYEGLEDFEVAPNTEIIRLESEVSSEQTTLDDADRTFSKEQKKPYQIHAQYIVSQIKSGFLFIDQQIAHERILYERYLSALEKQQTVTQKTLFPKTIDLSVADGETMRQFLPQLQQLGFDVQEFGQQTFVIHGIPADLPHQNEEEIIEDLLEQFKNNLNLHLNFKEKIAQALARTTSIKRGQPLTTTEMQHLIDELFACQMPYKGINGQNCFLTFDLNDLEKQFDG